MALLETSNARPSDGDSMSPRGERGAGFGIGERERERSYYGPKDKRKNKWAPRKTVWAESQLRFKVWHCRMPSPALPQSGTITLPKIVGVSYNLYDSLCIRYRHISPIYHDQKQIINTAHDHDT